MKNKQRYIMSKETTKNERKKIEEECKKAGMEIIDEEKCDVQYDIKSIMIYTADGSLVRYDKNQCSILFVQVYPYFKTKRAEEEKVRVHGKIICEIRMTPTIFRLLSDAMQEEIHDFEKQQQKRKPLEEFLKNKNDQMYG